jgi:imidazoleglycerol-phosphate dehydratase
MTRLERTSKETRVSVELGRGQAPARVETRLDFFNHMLSTLARYGGLVLVLRAEGDLVHHLMEDVGITLGQSLRKLVPKTAARFGERTVPMDDALVQAVVDVGGRAFYRGRLPSPLYQHWMQSFAENAGLTLHLRVLRGRNRHHVLEAAFKAVGLALREALLEQGEALSLKGQVTWKETEC